MEYLSTSLQKTKEIADEILKELLIKRRVAFYGDLGSGKTTLCRYIIQAACNDPNMLISSPTFNLVSTYQTPFGDIHHYDLYRIKHPLEIDEIGLMDALNSDQMCLVEWPEIIEPYFQSYSFMQVRVSDKDENSRIITIN